MHSNLKLMPFRKSEEPVRLACCFASFVRCDAPRAHKSTSHNGFIHDPPSFLKLSTHFRCIIHRRRPSPSHHSKQFVGVSKPENSEASDPCLSKADYIKPLLSPCKNNDVVSTC